MGSRVKKPVWYRVIHKVYERLPSMITPLCEGVSPNKVRITSRIISVEGRVRWE